MRKAIYDPVDVRLVVDIKGLQTMLSMGSYNANQIGEKAGAVIKFGRRKLYNVSKVNDYINRISEVNQTEHS